MVLCRAVFFLVSAALCGVGAGRAQSEPDYEHAPIRYSATAPRDALTRLQDRLVAGEVTLTGGQLQMLQTLLTELGVSADSQTLVFSRTSFPRSRIRPDQPRALGIWKTCTGIGSAAEIGSVSCGRLAQEVGVGESREWRRRRRWACNTRRSGDC